MSRPVLLSNTTIAGAGQELTVGSRTFPLPGDLEVKQFRDMAYAYDRRNNTIYGFVEAGQFSIPEDIGKALIAKHFGNPTK